jgi:hypothetical protein
MTLSTGIAWVGSICGDAYYRTAVVEYFENDMISAEVKKINHIKYHKITSNSHCQFLLASCQFDLMFFVVLLLEINSKS